MTSDADLIARVREALKQIPREILREPFPKNPAIDEMKAIRSYSQYAAEQALDTLARRLEELTKERDRYKKDAEDAVQNYVLPALDRARSLLHPEPQEAEQ